MKKKIEIIWNAFISISILLAIIWYYIPGHVDAIGSTGIQSFRYFTTDSNILIAISCVIWIRYLIRQEEIPHWLNQLRYAATTSGMLTFLEVLCFMSPMAFYFGGIKGVLRCYEDNVFILHFLAPLMMGIAFFKSDYNPSKRDIFISMIPMVIYSCVYLCMVVILKIWPDFYRFTFGGKYYLVPVIMVIMFSATYGIAFLLSKIKRHN